MRVLITGSSGFLGKHLVHTFQSNGYDVVPLPSVICDLRNLEDARSLFWSVKPDLLIHAAAICGGIGFNGPRQAEMFYQNTLLNLQTLEAARLAKISKIIGIASSCAYPDKVVPLKEDDLWAGLPHASVTGYGVAKRLQHLQAELYNQQYGMIIKTVFLTNLYGPGDYFDDRSHVIAALIRRFVHAQENKLPEVTIWGSGRPIREMLYVQDAAEGILWVAKSDHSPDEKHLNLGTGIGHSIANIAFIIRDVVGYKGQIVFDPDKPDGQAFKVLDVTRVHTSLPWTHRTPLEDGIRQTVEWYRREYNRVPA